MFNLPLSIQDVHGHIYTNAVVVISQIRYSNNHTNNSSAPFDTYNGMSPRQVEAHNGASLQFSAYIWKDVQAFTDKKHPMPLKDVTGQEWFAVSMDGRPGPFTTEQLEDLCENHLQDVILPTLYIAAE